MTALMTARPVSASPLMDDPTPTATPKPSYWRPLVVVASYSPTDAIKPGQDFTISLQIRNNGQRVANNVLIQFAAGDLIPRENGGISAISQLVPDEAKTINQAVTASSDLIGRGMANANVTISYTDSDGQAYSASVAITFNVKQPEYHPGPTATPTPTATPVTLLRPQLVISDYQTDLEKLQPGSPFRLVLKITNLGNAKAKGVTLVLGGGTVETNPAGTPQAGISGSGGEFTNFAPLGSSNIQYLGDLDINQVLNAEQELIVNVTTAPGAYPVKFSFIYSDDKGNRIVDNQVITLLVFRVPQVEMNFYRDPGMFYAGQMNMLPVQIVNLGRSAVVLGTLKVESSSGMVMNNTSLVGAVDMGGYFTLDASFMPDMPGPVDLTFSVNYTDDFNQLQTLTQTMTVEVMEAIDTGPMDPGMEIPMETPTPEPESMGDLILRVLKGLLGLDSARPTPTDNTMPPMDIPTESQPIYPGKG